MQTNSIFDRIDESTAERNRLRSLSLLIAGNGAALTLFSLLQKRLDPLAIDPFRERIAVYLLVLALLALANTLDLSHKNRFRLIATNRWIFIGQYFSLVARNHLSLPYALPAYFGVFLVASAFENPRVFLLWCAYVMGLASLCVSRNPELPSSVFFFTVAISLFGSFTVMTNRRRLLENLRLSEKLMRDVFSSANVGMALIDLDGKIVVTNRALARMLGKSERTFRRQSLIDYAIPEHRDRLGISLRRAAEGLAQEPSLELAFRGRDQRPRWGKVSPTRIVGADRVPCVLALVEDVTAQREAESLARDRQEKMHYSARMAALGEMAGGIAHEINNPLAVIDATARVIRDGLARGEPDVAFLGESLASIQKMIRRIATIISGLRRFSRDGSQDPLQTLPLHALLQDTLAFCREAFEAHGVVVHVEAPEDLLVRGRSVQLSQVVLNVLNNALDAMRDEPVKRVSLRAEREADFVRLEIANSGPPVPPELADKIFQPFFTTKPVGHGVGLGLSISLAMMSSQGGTLSLLREAEATTFVLLVPRAEAGGLDSAEGEELAEATVAQ